MRELIDDEAANCTLHSVTFPLKFNGVMVFLAKLHYCDF